MKTLLSIAVLLLSFGFADAAQLHYDGVQDDATVTVHRPPFFIREFVRARQVIDVTIFDESQIRIDTWDMLDDAGEQLIWSIAPGTYDLVHRLHGVNFDLVPYPLATSGDGQTQLVDVGYQAGFPGVEEPIWRLSTRLPQPMPEVTTPDGARWSVPLIHFAIPEPATHIMLGIVGVLALTLAYRCRKQVLAVVAMLSVTSVVDAGTYRYEAILPTPATVRLSTGLEYQIHDVAVEMEISLDGSAEVTVNSLKMSVAGDGYPLQPNVTFGLDMNWETSWDEPINLGPYGGNIWGGSSFTKSTMMLEGGLYEGINDGPHLFSGTGVTLGGYYNFRVRYDEFPDSVDLSVTIPRLGFSSGGSTSLDAIEIEPGTRISIIGWPNPIVGYQTFQLVADGAGSGRLADFDNDGDTDGDDFLIWQAGFGIDGSGDADQDGDTDGDDFLTWQSQFGRQAGGGAGVASVPEPATHIMLALVGLLAWCVARKGRA